MGKKLKVTAVVILALMGIGALSGGADKSDSTDTVSSSSVTSHKVVKKSSMKASAKPSSSSEKSSSNASSTSSSAASDATKGLAKADNHGLTGAVQQPLAYATSRQMVMQPLDHFRRAVDSHIQLSNDEEPTVKRAPSLSYNPVGWHNYKMYYGDGSKSAWLMARGHLVGYQFSGLNDEPRNLVPETAWMNSGNYSGMDQGNSDSMLYYENQLDNWLALHPNYRLDYQVTPLYSGDELLPREVRLAYVGYDQNGQTIEIRFGSQHETSGNGGATVVYLANVSPNATIDYATGMATGTVEKAATPVAAAPVESTQPATQPATQPEAGQGDRVVYVTGGGSSKVYWYGTDRMPSSTNMNNVIQMTENEAIQAGKRHSMTE
ncbi:DNA/RNA non-specific endonuclease [Weissella confusa]|uniref:DNA/RNA non-specific endonuclease n=1 Tax=Weissella confusa TaxID=1583 RepID=UPI00396F47AA